ncbi:allantoinase, mitochondrial-like [Scleropages formosus]|uniref:allantoinase n=1 Tax=Scleropages formosus TaxID=113540 RepID=A0A0N8JYL1_SCLFO|nr:allantoinase, mitochondrial-like [Scleropages formosus]
MEPGSTVDAVRSQRVLCGNSICPAVIVIKDGKILSIHPDSELPFNDKWKVLDVGNKLVMPGVVDCHVHVNEPGRVSWEGYWTATRAAAAGGVTTIVDMPLNSIPPTTTLESFREKMQAAEGQCFVDTAFWGGVVPGNQWELRPMIQAGVAGFKCFLIHSGVDEFPHVTDGDLHITMKQLMGTGSVLLFHAEREIQTIPVKDEDPCEYSTFLRSRPDLMEIEAIRTITQLCLQYQVRCHIVHLSSAQPLKLIQEARQAETQTYYDSMAALPFCHELMSNCTFFQEQLWLALKTGQIDMVVSDHSPCTPDLKKLETGDFTQAWGGISSLQFGLSLFWTTASQKGFSLSDVVRLLCQKPAELCGLGNQKGCLLPGHDADLVIWDPEKEFEASYSLTPYLGCKLRGEVCTTLLRGRIIYSHGFFSPQPLGKHLLISQPQSQASL